MTLAGREFLAPFQLGQAWFAQVDYRMFLLDWPREIESERGRMPISPDAYFSRRDEGMLERVWTVFAEQVKVGTDTKFVEDREVEFPVLSERDVARIDLMEFRFDVRVWQVVSERLAAGIEAAFPAVFRFDKVSVW